MLGGNCANKRPGARRTGSMLGHWTSATGWAGEGYREFEDGYSLTRREYPRAEIASVCEGPLFILSTGFSGTAAALRGVNGGLSVGLSDPVYNPTIRWLVCVYFIFSSWSYGWIRIFRRNWATIPTWCNRCPCVIWEIKILFYRRRFRFWPSLWRTHSSQQSDRQRNIWSHRREIGCGRWGVLRWGAAG